MTIIQGLFDVPDEFAHLPDHAEAKQDRFYQNIIRGIKQVFRAQGTLTAIRGVENIPSGGALIAANHTGWFDFIFCAMGPHVAGRRLVRFMAKKEVFSAPVIGYLMKGMRHVPVDRAAGADSIEAAVDWISNKDALVGIFPEGTISRSFELSDFKTGAARIAKRADAPLIPCVIWGSQRIWTKDLPRRLGRAKMPVVIRYGAPVPLEGTPEEVTARLKQAMQDELELARAEYSERFGPFPEGERWMPASMGGSAPTPAEAEEMYRREKAERAAAKGRRHAS